MAFGGMILNIVLNLVLIPRYQAFGSAYASLVTQLFTASVQVVLAITIFKLKPGARFIFQLLLFLGVVVVMGTISLRFSNWLYGYLFMIFSSVLLAILLKLLNLKDLYKIIRYE
jgi:O-antigen/teichoic acid export membrane protein